MTASKWFSSKRSFMASPCSEWGLPQSALRASSSYSALEARTLYAWKFRSGALQSADANMTVLPRMQSLKKSLFSSSCFFALLAAGLPAIWFAVQHKGVMTLTPDSSVYLFAAEHFFSNGGVFSTDGTPLTLFPPLYSIALALVASSIGSLTIAAFWVNLACLLFSSGIFYALLRKGDLAPITACTVTLILFLNPCMLYVFRFVWSESLYILLVLGLLLQCRRLQDNRAPEPARTGVMLGALVGIAFLTRYIGVTLLPVALVGVLLARNWTTRERFTGMAVAILTGFFFIGGWLLRNFIADGTLMGRRWDNPGTFAYALDGIVMTAGRFLMPGGMFISLEAGLLAVALAALVLALAFRPSRRLLHWIAPAFVLIVCHTGMMIYAQLTTYIDQLNMRYLSPEMPAAAFLIAAVLKHGRFSPVHSGQRSALALVAGLYLLAAFLD